MHKLLATAVLAAFSFTANAALVDYDTFTYDSEQNLDWLDLTATQNQLISEVELQLEVGGSLEGWRYATATEARAFFDEFAFPDYGFYNEGSEGFDALALSVNDFVSLLGNTAGSAAEGSYEVFGSKGYVAGIKSGYIQYSAYQSVSLDDTLQITIQSGNRLTTKNGASPESGHFLVRTSTIPVPAAIWLFGSALAGLGWMKRKQTV